MVDVVKATWVGLLQLLVREFNSIWRVFTLDYLLPTALATNVMQIAPSVRLFPLTKRPLTLIFCLCMGHDHSTPEIEAKVKTWSVQPWVRAILVVSYGQKMNYRS